MGIWGPGGLFEQAVQNKMKVAQQGADASTMGANANMMGAFTGQQAAGAASTLIRGGGSAQADPGDRRASATAARSSPSARWYGR